MMRGRIVFRIMPAVAYSAVFVCAAAVFAASTTNVPAARNQVKPERLEFPRGVTELTRKGSLRGYTAREYVFSASEGQTLSVKLDTKSGYLVFSVSDKDTMEALNTTPPPVQVTEWDWRAPKTGDYVISVYFMLDGARRNLSATYALKTSVMGNALAQTADVTSSGEQKTFNYRCDYNIKVAVTFSQTDPPKARLNRDGQEWILPFAPSDSGSRYSDGKTTFWIKGDDAMFELAGKTFHCKIKN